MNALPQAMAGPNIHMGIIAGKLNGVMPGSHADGLAHGEHVDAGSGTFGVFTLEQVRDAAGELDDFQAALQIAVRVREHLAVFFRQQAGQVVGICSTRALNLNMTRARRWGLTVAHSAWAGTAATDGVIDLGGAGQGNLGLHVTECLD